MQHGSFDPLAVQKFMKLMAESGETVNEMSFSEGAVNFSRTAKNESRNFVADMNEVRGEYIENYDYTRCVRPDGTVYGSRGKCKKGVEQAKSTDEAAEEKKRDMEENDALTKLQGMLPKGEKIVMRSGKVFGE